MKNFLLLAIALLLASVTWSQNDKSKTILDQLTQKTRSYKTISANFTLSMQNKEMGINEKKEGVIKVKGQKYSVDLPGAGVKIFSDGKTIWNFMKKGNQVTISNIEDSESELMNPSSLFNIYEKGFKSKFVSEKKVGGKTVYNIDLLPDSKQKDVSKVKLVIDKNAMFLQTALLFTNDGNQYGIDVKKFETNIDYPDNEFVFDPKKVKDIEIIDLR